jgi:anti-sigma regulatory factor (Ser/Thr protein kinase)
MRADGPAKSKTVAKARRVRARQVARIPHPPAPAGRERFEHEALFYAGDAEFLAGTLSFAREGLQAGEPVLVAVGAERTALLSEALGEDADGVSFIDMQILGINPARIIPAWRQFLQERAADGRPVRGIGEPIWPGRSAAELTESERHESLLNLAFDGGQGWRLLCPYDIDALDDAVIETAGRNHPLIAQGGDRRRSDRYLHFDEAPGPFDGTLPAPLARVQERAFVRDDLRGLRGWVSERASEAMLGTSRSEQLVLAVNELASNSVRYGGGGLLRTWHQEGTLYCEVHDDGRIEQPLAGRIRPGPDQYTGRGLWLANQLCDLVQIRSNVAGTVVRVHMRVG